MTALSQYERLESIGLWRPPSNPQGKDDGSGIAPANGTHTTPQRREVFVSFGSATLVLSDKNGTALTHWSLPAIDRLNPGKHPALFTPDQNSGETLELADSDMISAIEKVRRAISRPQPRSGRLRFFLTTAFLLLLLGLAVFWLPGALIRQTAMVVPDSKRVELGKALLANIARVSGAPCSGRYSDKTLAQLSARLAMPGASPQRLLVLPAGVTTTQHLPGNIMILNRSLVEDYDDPDVVAGYILAEQLRAQKLDPLQRLLRSVGLIPTVRLLTTGELPKDALERYAETLLTMPAAPISDQALLARFEQAGRGEIPGILGMLPRLIFREPGSRR